MENDDSINPADVEKIYTRVPTEMAKRLRIAAATKGLSPPKAIAEAIQAWLDAPPPAQPIASMLGFPGGDPEVGKAIDENPLSYAHEGDPPIVNSGDSQAPKNREGEFTTRRDDPQIESIPVTPIPDPEVQSIWIPYLLAVLRSTKPGLAQALLHILVQLKWAADAYELQRYGTRQGEALPAAANAPSELRSTPHPGEGDDADQIGGGKDHIEDKQADREFERAQKAGRRREQGEVGHPRKDRKGGKH